MPECKAIYLPKCLQEWAMGMKNMWRSNYNSLSLKQTLAGFHVWQRKDTITWSAFSLPTKKAPSEKKKQFYCLRKGFQNTLIMESFNKNIKDHPSSSYNSSAVNMSQKQHKFTEIYCSSYLLPHQFYIIRYIWNQSNYIRLAVMQWRKESDPSHLYPFYSSKK